MTGKLYCNNATVLFLTDNIKTTLLKVTSQDCRYNVTLKILEDTVIVVYNSFSDTQVYIIHITTVNYELGHLQLILKSYNWPFIITNPPSPTTQLLEILNLYTSIEYHNFSMVSLFTLLNFGSTNL